MVCSSSLTSSRKLWQIDVFTWFNLKSCILFLVNPTFDMNLLREALIRRCCGVTVITSALHAEGFSSSLDSTKESFWQNDVFNWINLNHAFYFWSINHLIRNYCFEVLIPRCCGAAVITSVEHAEGLQFKPGQHQEKVATKWCLCSIKIKSMDFTSSQSENLIWNYCWKH